MICQVASVVPSCLRPCGLKPTRLLSPWDSPGKNSGMGCHFLLQGIFLTQGLNRSPLHWRADSLHLGVDLNWLICFKCTVPFVICVTAGIMGWRDQQWARRFSNLSDVSHPRVCKKEDSDLVGLGWGPRFSLSRWCCYCSSGRGARLPPDCCVS